MCVCVCVCTHEAELDWRVALPSEVITGLVGYRCFWNKALRAPHVLARRWAPQMWRAACGSVLALLAQPSLIWAGPILSPETERKAKHQNLQANKREVYIQKAV